MPVTALPLRLYKVLNNRFINTLLVGAFFIQAVYAAEIDPKSGLIQDDNWQLVLGHCSACHSLKLVTSNRADRPTWLETIRWMQETQNLWQFDAATEDKLLTYLAKNYGPLTQTRRPALPIHLMPK